MEYEVNVVKTEEGYSVWVPMLEGCVSQGATKEEALENIKDAIQSYLASKEEEERNTEKFFVKV
ncbi:MAG: type II toxin-antitoxin system HicB family antitoxin [Nitrospirae bacterium]|nr:type II toxin-antitoxin system HicB family antitoxin [Nitrospirota bacterium]